MGWHRPENPQMYLEQTTLVRLHLALLRFFPMCNNVFIIINQCRFFTSGIGLDNLMNVLKDCIQKQPSGGVLRKRYSENMKQIYRRTPLPKYDFNKVALQLYWNRTSAWVFSCKFAAYFQNTFSQEHLWRATSDCIQYLIWTAWVLINFYEQKQRLLVRSVMENASFISFHWGIWSIYSEINKFEISKDLIFQK